MTPRRACAALLFGVAFLPSCGLVPSSPAPPSPAPASAEPTQLPTPPPHLDHTADILRDFPLQVGATWVYSVDVTYAQGVAEDGTFLLSSWTGAVTETVFGSHPTTDGLVFEARREVEPDPPPGVWLDIQPREYIVTTASITVGGLTIYRWPLQEGSAWAAFAGNIPDLNYQYEVGAPVDVETPLGALEGCYPLTLRTRPDATYEVFCPGIGPALRDYLHNGEPQEQHWRLESFGPG